MRSVKRFVKGYTIYMCSRCARCKEVCDELYNRHYTCVADVRGVKRYVTSYTIYMCSRCAMCKEVCDELYNIHV